jgi:hypothetical protein
MENISHLSQEPLIRVERTPVVTINGPTQIAATKDDNPVSRSVAVSVTDEDKLSAQANSTVRIHIVSEDPTVPPLCRAKPWLPQCQ